MDFFTTNQLENEFTKDLVEKIILLFKKLNENDSALTVLLMDYLCKLIGKNSENCFDKSVFSENNNKISICTQTEQNEFHEGWDMKDISNEVKQVAEQCMNQTGLNFDKTSGTYYNNEEGYYYIPDYRLYYYPKLSAYYYYDDASDTLKFHSSVAAGESSSAMETQQGEESSSSNFNLNEKEIEKNVCDINVGESAVQGDFSEKNEKLNKNILPKDKEEGELSSSDEEEEECVEMEENKAQVIFESGPKPFEPDHTKHNAPCMRMIIVKSSLENYKAGTLFLVTRDGGTLGREGIHHAIVLPDTNISKDHLKIQYVYKGDTEQRYAYEVIDLGSRNGTRVNGKRLSHSNKLSEPEEISHGSVITIGSTTLLCHIHKDMDSCSECQTVDKPVTKNNLFSKGALSAKQQHYKQIMQMKHKYQLNTTTEEDVRTDGYTDRAKVRRDTVGSSHDSEKTEMASVHIPMNKKNKGYNLLSKMGWKEGDNLGKNASSSLQEPLHVEPKNDKSGFGA